MARRIVRMPSGQGIAASQTATFNLPLGLTYIELLWHLQKDVSGTATDLPLSELSTHIGEIRVVLDGVVTVRADAADLVSLWTYYGQTGTAGALPLYFSRPWQRTMQGEDFPAYGTQGVQSLTVEMDLKSTYALTKLDLFAVQGPGEPLGQYWTLRQYAKGVGVTGEVEISDIPRGAYGSIAMHVKSDDISAVEVITNDRKLIDQSRTVMNAYLAERDRTPQTGFTHIDFCATDRLGDVLPMNLQDFRLKLQATATGNFPIFVEEIQGTAPAA